MNIPFFSIIIPVFNVEKYIFRCLTSVYSQDIEEELYEVIVVNDGTPDNSMAIVEEFAGIHLNIVIVNKKNGGVSSARNKGIELSKGKFLLFVDPDDSIVENTLLKLYNKIVLEKSEIFILNSYELDSDLNRLKKRYPFPNKMKTDNHNGIELLKHYGRGSVCGCVFSKKFILKIKLKFLVGLRNAEDSLYMGMALMQSKSVTFINIDFYNVHKREDSASSSWDLIRILDLSHALKYISEQIEKKSLSIQQLSVLNYRKYQIISTMVFQFIKLNEFKNFKKLKKVINDNTSFPLYNNHVKKAGIKLFILNRSFYIFFLLFFLKEKIKSITKIN